MVSDIIVIVVTLYTLQRERPLVRMLGRRTVSDALFMNGEVPLIVGIAD